MSNMDENLKDAFTQVFKNNSWQGKESVSGPGSDTDHPTIKDLEFFLLLLINKKFKHKNTITIVDMPCGDMNFINTILNSVLEKTHIKRIRYCGYDIVPELITLNIAKLANKKFNNIDYTLEVLDITQKSHRKADIIICKELFIHLSYKHIKCALYNFIISQSSYLLYGINFDGFKNKDIEYSVLGECREVCLLSEPFNLPPAIMEYKGYKIWELNEELLDW